MINPTPVLKTENICYLLLAHQKPDQVGKLLDRWADYCTPPSQVLLCYGGPHESFDQISHPAKIFLDDPRLRTKDHQREKQSYTQLFKKASLWLRDYPDLSYVYLAEFDHWPLVQDLGPRLIERMHREDADVLGHQLARRDGTSCVYYAYHLSDSRFLPWLKSISRRSDPGVVFNMFGSGSFWSREAFLAVGAVEETLPIYLEMYLPTLAHHLGFRLRDFQDQSRYIWAGEDRYQDIEEARSNGSWTIHPIKTLPS